MSRMQGFFVGLAVLAWVFISPGVCHAVLIAHWSFEPGNFLADSSPNGHTLANGAGGAAATSDTVNIPPGGGSGSAAFDGGDIMQTIANLDLSGFSTISVSWWQRTTSSAIGVLFEHSLNKNLSTGGFLADTNEAGTGVGLPDIVLVAGNNNEQMPHAIDGTWQQFTMTLDLTAAIPANVLEVSTGGAEGGNAPATGTVFRNDIFFIGARGQGPSFNFNGNIDELRIEAIPEPSSALLLALGGLMLRPFQALRRGRAAGAAIARECRP